MAFRRRRFKRRLTWFPPLGGTFTVAEEQITVGFTTISVPVPNTGLIGTTEIPLTFDFGEEAFLADAAAGQIRSLADLLQSGWRCRRVVGKIFLAFHPDNSGQLDPLLTSYGACIVSAGLMVRKVDAFTQPAIQTISTLERDDYTDPWFFRRSWVLGQDARYNKNQFVRSDNSIVNVFNGLPGTLGAGGPPAADTFAAFNRFPNTTAHYAGSLDGGHIDAKTNRIIGPEDRLFLTLSARGLPVTPEPTLVGDNDVIGVIDLRLLGSPMRATNRRNASR